MGAESYTKYVSVTEKGTKEVLGEFKKILPPLEGKKILDVGCGTGLLVEHYLKSNEVNGLDNNSASLETAKKKGINVKQHDLEKPLPHENNYFDLVVCKDVLEFIYNSEQLLDEMIRITKKKGSILIHVPNEFTIIDLANIFLGNGIVKKRWYGSSSELNNPHVRFFTRKGLSESLKEKGLAIEHDHSNKWVFSLPIIKIKPRFLSLISTRLFSPGITFLCTKK